MLSLRELLELRVAMPADAGPTHALVRANLTGTHQLYRVPYAGGELERLTDEAEPVSGLLLDDGRVVVSMDAGGDENEQLYLLEPGGPPRPLVVEPEVAHWTPRVHGSLLAYACNRRNGVDFDVVVRELGSGEEHAVWERGGYAEVDGFSPDGSALAFSLLTEKPGDNELYLADLASGEVEHLSPHDEEAFFGTPAWVGGALHYASNSGRDKQAIVRHGEGVVLESEWDLDLIADPSGRRLIVHENADGYSRLFVAGGPEIPLPGRGVVEGARITRPVVSSDGRRLLYCFSSPVEPGDVFAYDLERGETRRLTRTHPPVEGAVEPQLRRFASFDGESVPVFLYENPGRPVVIWIHGGPESQLKPQWFPLHQWFLANGFALAAPNVRGSTGYGRRYEHLDDVHRRLDAVGDVVALHEWLGAERPAILFGASYGGYMVLAGLAFHPERFAAGVDVVGISSFVTFLENTAAYRRAVREREYGSLARDREFLESASPLTHVDRIRAPLFVVHGANDPRVPLSEAQQLVASLEARGVPCELLVYEDEGHGLQKLANQLDAYPRAVEFLARVLEGVRV